MLLAKKRKKNFIGVKMLLESQAVQSTHSALQYTVQQENGFTATYGNITRLKNNIHRQNSTLCSALESLIIQYVVISAFAKKKKKKKDRTATTL